MSTTTASNGYMVRLELLKMAKEMLEQDWHAQRESVMSDYSNRVDVARGKAESVEFATVELPAAPVFRSFPTEEEIIKKAKVLNEFINTK